MAMRFMYILLLMITQLFCVWEWKVIIRQINRIKTERRTFCWFEENIEIENLFIDNFHWKFNLV